MGLGLAIPLFIFPPIVDTRVASIAYPFDDSSYRILSRIWIANAAPALPQQLTLLALFCTQCALGRQEGWLAQLSLERIAKLVKYPDQFLRAIEQRQSVSG